MKYIIIICGIIYGLAILPIYILYHIFIKIDVYTNMCVMLWIICSTQFYALAILSMYIISYY
jgi:hypothetical protein